MKQPARPLTRATDHPTRRSLLRALRGRGPADDRGLAMITVLGVTLVLSALVVATLAFTVNGVRSARGDQDWQAALPAAEAGIDDYLSRLNEDSTYWKFGNPSIPYSSTSAVSLPTGSKTNPAFSGWTEVPGSAARASYRYEVNTTAFFTTGLIKVRSTGRVGNRTRTVESSIGRRNFIDYLYFTDFEVKDPDLYATPGDSYNPGTALANCNRHLYDLDVLGVYRRDKVNSDAANRTTGDGCSVINFIGPGVVSGFAGDRIDGPFHSNDAVYVCGNPTITAEATTSYNGSLTGGRRYIRNTGCSTTSTPQIPVSGNNFLYKAPLTLPPSNTALSLQTDPTHTDNQPGCLYTGPTQITFTAAGTMDVISPWSKNGGSAYCGTGTGLALPTRGVIWVRDVPGGGATASVDAYSRTRADMLTQAVPGSTCSATTSPLNHPRAWEQHTSRRDRTPYSCTAGDVLVRGKVKGQVTVGSANNVVVIDDLEYATSGCSASAGCTDVIGLVANNYVEIMHPVGCDSSGGDCRNLTTTQDNLTLDAAVLSVQHSFRVQNFNLGSSMGTLTVRGAIGQKYRGAVGTTGGTGVNKNYVYDWRLRYASPPYFLDPVKSSYGQKTWTEPQAAYGP